ncbi:OmpA family protein [Cytophaga hutchinsonii]|jgi:outer membrane protein OmpA-like peptidoglycan-associated protein|uniref:OmpA family protein n=1 Tax=Cytophaga hutchinsonii TaxID=985 RepID=UPI000038F2DF|nr:OmpA family protein [Cytophaga hutchinsonii]SFX96323.1 WD40-like Beta Propeller Repeat [Cytophaga hutchinsonii ATCC 33406]
MISFSSIAGRLFVGLSLLLFISTSLYAQSPSLFFFDDFETTSKGWYEGETEKYSFKITNGGYLCTNKSVSGETFWSTNSTYLNPDKEFTYQFKIKELGGYASDGAGIYLSAGNNKYFYFVINPERFEYAIASSENGKNTFLYEYYGSNTNKRTAAIKPRNVTNTLEIAHKGSNILFRLNDTELLSIPYAGSGFESLTGVFGIFMRTNMTVVVEEASLYHDVQIKTVPNLTNGIKRENLGANINTIYAEKLPYIAADGKTLYYSIQGNPANTGGTMDGDEIYVATAAAEGNWNKSTAIGKPLNNAGPNAVISVTPDNNSMLIMNQYNADGTQKGSGVSFSYRTESGWSVPADVVINNFYNRANTNEYSLSADRKVLFMTLQRDDSKGDKDVYVSFLQKDGSFSTPLNLGSQVNTSKGELTPFIAADGVTLYFATYGHPTYGSADIYMTRRLDSTYTNWSEPLNLGPEINSTAWDAYYSVEASGKYAYMVTAENSIGDIDIVRIALPQSAKPKPVVLVYGKVLHATTKLPLKANIQYVDLATGKEIGIATSDPKTGEYKIVLPTGANYGFLAQKENFFSVSDNMDLNDLKEYKELERNLYLAPLITGQTIRLNNLFFDTGKSDLRKESYAELNRTVELMKLYLTMTIEISGHTDNVGGDAENQTLSENRAKAVVNYLVSHGIDASRVQSKGYGKTKPVSTNDTDHGRQLNRRVDFTIIKM